jgi:hypothetical protein
VLRTASSFFVRTGGPLAIALFATGPASADIGAQKAGLGKKLLGGLGMHIQVICVNYADVPFRGAGDGHRHRELAPCA